MIQNSETLIHKELTDRIIRCAIEVRRALGPGLLESAYEVCLFDELQRNDLAVASQVGLPIEYKGKRLDCGYRIDLLVENAIIIEVKAVEKLAPIHTAQLLTYMRLANLQVGLILNFNVKLLRDGIVRQVLTNPNPPSALSASSAVNSS